MLHFSRENKMKFRNLFVVCIFSTILSPIIAIGVSSFMCPGDLNGDCKVDLNDLFVFAENWLLTGQRDSDFNGSNSVDFEDFAMLAERWLQTGGLDGADHKIFNISDLITSGPWLDARNYGSTFDVATINSALSNIGVSNVTLLIAGGSWSISSPLTIPSNVNLRFERGSVFDVATGVMVNINGTIDAGLYRIFDGTGGINFSFSAVPYTYPQWWGAASDGVASTNTTAFRAAISTGRVFVPAGRYSINGSLGNLSNCTITGVGKDISKIQGNSSDIIMLDGISGDCKITDMGFDSGSIAANISNTEDGAVITIEKCLFTNQAVASIAGDSDVNAVLTITDCEFITSDVEVNSKAVDVGVKQCSIINAWVSVRSDVAIKNRCGLMKIESLLGGPINNNTGTCWIENYGSLHVNRSRFGGEYCGRTVVKNYAALKYQNPVDPVEIVITNSLIYSACSYAYVFYELPNKLILKDNGPYLGGSLYFDSAISAQSRRYFPEIGYFKNDDGIQLLGQEELTQIVSAKDYSNLDFSASPLVTNDIAFSMPSSATGMVSNGTAPVTSETLLYNNIEGRKYQATVEGQNINLYYTVPSSRLTIDTLYTAVFDIVNEAKNPLLIQVFFGDSREQFIIGPGLHVISVPYFWGYRKSTTMKVKVDYLHSDDVIKIGRFRVFKGNHNQNTVNTTMYGNSASSVPANSYVKYYPGDQIVYMDSIAGGYTGRQCVVSGTPGVWKDLEQISW